LPAHHFTDVLELLRNALIRADRWCCEGVADLGPRPLCAIRGRRTEKSPACIARSTSSSSFQIEFRDPLPREPAAMPVALFSAGDRLAFTSMTNLHADPAKCKDVLR